MKRIASSPEMDPATEQNKNIQWAHGLPIVLFYIGFVLVTRFVVGLIVGVPLSWSLINISHCIMSFFFLHLLRGVPFSGIAHDQGKFDSLTLWEQFDGGSEFTKTKKFLTITPIVLFLVTIYFNEFDSTAFIINFLPLLPVLIFKLPAGVHKQRAD